MSVAILAQVRGRYGSSVAHRFRGDPPLAQSPLAQFGSDLSKRLGLEFKTSDVNEYEHATEVLLHGLGCRATRLDHGQGEGQVLNVRPEHDEAVWAAMAAAES